MFKKVLIANRGEIAVRVMMTCKEMGIKTVAVFSEADRLALHVLEADESVFLGPSDPSESYLHMGRILEAARRCGAEAIHPGYGFLAENGDFAEACVSAGIVFVGPPAQVIRDLGSKTRARRIMAAAGVPVIPGMMAAAQAPSVLRREANDMGYPVLVKAVAGGGGKGMRTVWDEAALEEACISAASEAMKAFGDGSLYLEKVIPSPRHVEFQILADRAGNVVHLFERECSIQRRHQKIIEETPSPALTPELRDRMGLAAVAAARASGYVNAGTVEFLLDQGGAFYFLEVNTRLQVEHPITEMTTGLDLVRHQLEIAAGNPLPFGQADITQRGHAIECRIYAEDPEAGFYPSPGPVALMREPSGPGVRNDCGIYQGFEVPVEYDPILSKLVVFGEDRNAARKRMIRALEGYAILGIRTSIPFLLDVVRSEPFAQGMTSTDFIETFFPGWRPSGDESEWARIAYVVDEMQDCPQEGRAAAAAHRLTPWQRLGDWQI
jgi:acetyl-CoA carboxylase biotin carboxylase subunit